MHIVSLTDAPQQSPCLLLPRVSCSSGVHRAPTVALSVVGALMLHSPTVKVADVFLMSLVGQSAMELAIKGRRAARNWRPEARRLQTFLLSGHPVYRLSSSA